MTNNRYSCQNKKSFQYQDDGGENEGDAENNCEDDMCDDDEEVGVEDVADEEFCRQEIAITEIDDCEEPNRRRTSMRYKDRVISLRVQSQETCQRFGTAGGIISQTFDATAGCSKDYKKMDGFGNFERVKMSTLRMTTDEQLALGETQNDEFYQYQVTETCNDMLMNGPSATIS